MKKVSTEDMLQAAFKKVKPEHMALFVRALADVAFERAEQLNKADREGFFNFVQEKLAEFQISENDGEFLNRG